MKNKDNLCSTVPMRTAKIGYIVLSAVLCVLGVIIIAFPIDAAEAFSMWCGITFIAFGCIKVIGFFSKDLYRLAFQFDLEFGILMVILGIFILLHPDRSARFICTALGVLVLTDSLFKIRITLEAKRFGIGTWWATLLIAAVSGVFGVILLFSPTEGTRILMIFLGVTLAAEGALNMSTALTMVKIIHHQLQDDEQGKR